MTATLTPPRRKLELLDVHGLGPERAVSRLIEQAVRLRCSDLFFNTNDQHVAAQVRHLGMLRPISILPPELGKRCLAHIKALAQINTTATRRPLDGRWIYETADGDAVDIRINIIPTVYGEDFALRLLARAEGEFKIDDIGMTGQQHDQYNSMIASPSGLILLCGPTGSGKTTTLYASLMRLNDGRRKINTIEDPIEHVVEGLRQSQVNPAVDLGFSDLLRAVLRQSPDIIMIGEIRDAETAQIAVHAANSGALVFATVHATGPAGAVQSMRSLGVNSHFLASALRGVLSQRLVRTFCEHCRISFDLSDAPETFEEVKPLLSVGEGGALYAPHGCEECSFEGYAGRTGVFEVMPISRALRELVADAAPTSAIGARAVEEGMLEFRQAALLKVAQGLTSIEEVFRVIPPEHLMLEV